MKRVVLVLTVGALVLALTATVAMAATRHGTNGDDLMYGTNNADQMYGYGGNDLMYGLAGNDLMYGGSGDDYVYGRDGNDNLLAELEKMGGHLHRAADLYREALRIAEAQPSPAAGLAHLGMGELLYE